MDDRDAGWITTVRLDSLQDGRPSRVELDGEPVMVVRHDGQVFAIGDRCTHQGAPLHRGPVTFAGSPPVITCPVHGSRYALDTGKVLRGPATVAATAYDVRVDEGTVQIRRQG